MAGGHAQGTVGLALLLRALPTFPRGRPAACLPGVPPLDSARHTHLSLVTLQAAKLLYESRDQ